MQERTIKEVMNLDSRELIYADDFFLQDENIIWKYRELCQEAIKKRTFSCLFYLWAISPN